MAVTKPVRTAVLLCSMAVLLVGYQNCSVALTGSTPGASTFTCNPTANQLQTFEQLEATIFTATSGANCGGCHTENGGRTPSGFGQFPMLENPTNSEAITFANYCTISNRGNDGMSVIFGNGHGGGPYAPGSYQNLVDFFANL